MGNYCKIYIILFVMIFFLPKVSLAQEFPPHLLGSYTLYAYANTNGSFTKGVPDVARRFGDTSFTLYTNHIAMGYDAAGCKLVGYTLEPVRISKEKLKNFDALFKSIQVKPAQYELLNFKESNCKNGLLMVDRTYIVFPLPHLALLYLYKKSHE